MTIVPKVPLTILNLSPQGVEIGVSFTLSSVNSTDFPTASAIVVDEPDKATVQLPLFNLSL